MPGRLPEARRGQAVAFPPCARPRPAPRVRSRIQKPPLFAAGRRQPERCGCPRPLTQLISVSCRPNRAPWNPSSAASGYRTAQSLRFPGREQPLSREKFPSSSSWDPRRHTAKKDGRGWEVRSHDAFRAVSVAVGRVRTLAGRQASREGWAFQSPAAAHCAMGEKGSP